MRDRSKRRNQQKNRSQQPGAKIEGPAPLQPTFLDRNYLADTNGENKSADGTPQPFYESQPEADPFDGAQPGGRRSRRRGRGGRSRNRRRTQQQAAAALPGSMMPGLPIVPGQATGEAAEIDTPVESPEGDEAGLAENAARTAEAKESSKAQKGAVVLAIGLPGSGKSSWFKRHNIIPLSSDLVRGLLFDDATEQRYQDLVFSSLRSLLRARLLAARPMNFIDATNLSPKERHSWIKMAHDFGYEAHAVFFDVPAEVCMERNRKRERNVPDEVMVRMAQKLRPPKFDEGFAKIIVVKLKLKKEAVAENAAVASDENNEANVAAPAGTDVADGAEA